MKRGQIQQVFIYLMGMLVIGFLVLLGYRAIDNIMDKQCEVRAYKFQTTLEERLDSSTRYEAVTPVSIDAPCNYDRLCLVDADYFNPELNPAGQTKGDLDNNPTIYANAADNIQFNVYLIHKKAKDTQGYETGETEGVLWNAGITVDRDPETTVIEPGILCVNIGSGGFEFWLKGLGKAGILAFAPPATAT